MIQIIKGFSVVNKAEVDKKQNKTKKHDTGSAGVSRPFWQENG